MTLPSRVSLREAVPIPAGQLEDIKGEPAVAYLPEPRDQVAARETLARRIRREFEEMPGMSLTLVQATRLFGIPYEGCSRILLQLVDNGLLRLTPDGRYSLRPGAA